LFEYVPVATYCCVFPAARVVAGGFIVIACSTAAVTVTVVEPVTPERLALTTGSPVVAAVVIRPPLTVAPAPLVHVAWLVMSCVLPSV
jgi:hypothetical protein